MIAWGGMNTQPLPPGVYYCGGSGTDSHLNAGTYQSCHLYPSQAFAPWEVALTAVLAVLVVATAFVFLRRLRRA